MFSPLAKRRSRKSRNGRHRFGGARFLLRLMGLLWLAGSWGAAQAAVDVDEAAALADAGTPELALALVERDQPADPAGEEWTAWEGLRLKLLRAMGRWEALAERTEASPEGLPEAFRHRVKVENAEALLRLGRAAEARSGLRREIWAGAQEERLTLLRRLVIRSYLEQGLAEDAYAAVVRYRQDYGESGREDRLLIARVLLTRQRYSQVESLLAGLDGPRAEALRLLNALRSEKQSARGVLKQARALAARSGNEPAQTRLLWAVAAEAAGLADNPSAQIPALENLFESSGGEALPEGLFHFTGDDLWQAYEGYAGRVGNREQMLVGEDRRWFDEAENAGARYPIRIRSVYALLSLRASREEHRLEAQEHLLGILSERPSGHQILRRLYLDSGHFPSLETIPDPVRWALADAALAEGDMEIASRLLHDLETAPEGTRRVMWQLRRAKVFILAADYDSAESVLSGLVARAGELERGDVDRLMQLLFDLQTVGENTAAYEMFAQLGARAEGQFKRELLYWMADSRAAQEQHVDAARLYLQSAMLPGPKTMDPWAQTARYKAAGSLAAAGLREDAAKLYRQLLAVTEEAGRKAVLRRDLEQLWLERGDG